MTFYIFTRENLALFQQVHNEPDKAVIYGSDQIVLRWPNRHGQQLQPVGYVPRYPNGLPSSILPRLELRLPEMHRMQLPPLIPPIPLILTDSELESAIYITDMILPNGEKLSLRGILSLEAISFYTSIFNQMPTITQIILYETSEMLLFLYDDDGIALMFLYSDKISHVINRLTEIGLQYTITLNNNLIIPHIDDPEKYYIVNQIYSLPDYEKITGNEYKVNFAEMVRKFPKYAENVFLHDPTTYQTIFDDLITEADLQDFLIEAGQNFIAHAEDMSKDKQLAYFNTGMILANHPDQAKRDLAIDYLLKAGDMPEAKTLRTRLFLSRVGLDLDIPINLDLDTLFKLASLIKK